MARFELELLGVPRVLSTRAEEETLEVRWRLRRSLEVLALLATSPGHRASRDRLVLAIWPDADIDTVERNLHPTISGLRQALGERSAVLLRQGIYQLNPDLVWEIDIERFEEAARAGRGAQDASEAIAHLERAWRLYRGDFLSGWDGEWANERRDALRRERVELLVRLGELYVREGRERDALDAYRSVLLEEPYDEKLHVAVMEIYARQKRRDLVRKQYLKLREQLGELGVEPLAETEELFHRLMR